MPTTGAIKPKTGLVDYATVSPRPKQKKKPSKPQSLTSLGAPYTSTRWGDTIGSVNSGASPIPGITGNPMRGSDNPLGGYFNNSFAGNSATGGSAAENLLRVISDIAANQNNGGGGGGTITQTGGGNTVTGNTANTAGAAMTGNVEGAQTYQDRFGGSPTDISQFGYTPTGMIQMNQNGNFDVLIADMLAQAGITDPQMIKDLTQQAKYGSLIDMIAGGDPNAPQSVGFIADYINQMMTPNGQVPTFDELVNLLIGGDANKYATGIQNSSTENELNNYIMDLLDSVGGNQYYQKAMYGTLDQSQRQYNANKYKGGAGGSYSEQLRNNGFFG